MAYESQLKSERAQRHRALANAIEARESPDESAALVAEHLEAAGDLHAAYAWHMRAGEWSSHRDIIAARTSWRRAQRVADQLPDDDPDRMAMRIAPRTYLAGTAWRIGGGLGDPHFDELRELCLVAGDRQSLAIGLSGAVTHEIMNARREEASRLASELVELLESIGDPGLIVPLTIAPIAAKHEAGEVSAMLALAQRVIDAREGARGVASVVFDNPLSFAVAARGIARFSMGMTGWRDDLDTAISLTNATNDPMARATMVWWVFGCATSFGVLLPDETTLRVTAETLSVMEQSGDNYALDTARLCRAVVLLSIGGEHRRAGLELLEAIRTKAHDKLFTLTALPIADLHIARELTRLGDVDAGVELARAVADHMFDCGGCIWTGLAAEVLAEALLQRGRSEDLHAAQAVIHRLASVPTDPGFVLHEVILLRLHALLARARGDDDRFRDFAGRYRKLAVDLGFEGHIARAEAMVCDLPTSRLT